MKNPALACGVFHVFICHWLLGKIIHYALILPSTIDHSSPIFLYEKKNMAPLGNKEQKQNCLLSRFKKLPHAREFFESALFS